MVLSLNFHSIFVSVIILKKTLENLFAHKYILNCSIHNHKKGPRLYIWEESMNIVRNEISSYMHKDMLYKINYNKSKFEI